MPKDVPETLPGVRVVASEARGSYELKNVGVQAADRRSRDGSRR